MELKGESFSLSVKQLEKELHKTTSLLNDTTCLKNHLENIFAKARHLEELTEENKELAELFKKHLKNEQTLSLFKRLESQLNGLKSALTALEDQEIQSNLFLERFRSKRDYTFERKRDSLNFLLEAFSLFDVKKVFFKPQFVGTINLTKTGKELKLLREGISLIIPVEKIRNLLVYLGKNEKKASIVFESPFLKIVWKDEFNLSIEAENIKIKRLDRLCKETKGDVISH